MRSPLQTGAAVLTLFGALWLTACEDPEPKRGPVPAQTAGSGRPLQLTDIGKQAGLDVVQTGGGPNVDYIIDSIGAGAAWLDYDGDGNVDLYLAQGATPDSPIAGPPDILLRNLGDPDGDGIPKFEDVTRAAGLGDTLWSFGVAAADYDADGDSDIYLTNWGRNRLYRNNGDGTFTDVAREAGLDDERWGVSAVWGDIDRDGDLDLYVANYVAFGFDRYPARGEQPANNVAVCVWRGVEVYCGPRNLEPAQDALFRNDGDPDGDGIPVFTDVTASAGLAHDEPLFALAAHFFDADNDGDDDLYVANDSVRNSYFVNRGDGTFAESGMLSGLAYNEQGHEQAGMGIASGDYDRDGWPDLVVTNFSHDHDTVYRNMGDGSFFDVSFRAGIGSVSYLTLAWGVSFVDLDHDGWEDLFVAHGHVYPQVEGRGVGTSFKQRNSLFHNRGDGTFAEVTEDIGGGMQIVKSSRSLAPVDLDGDGDLDLLLTSLNDTPDLLRNDGAPGNWLQVRLIGSDANRDALGAKVLLEGDSWKQRREIRCDTGFAASTLPVAHFGLGRQVPRRLEVRWPSGAVSVVDDPDINRLHTLRE